MLLSNIISDINAIKRRCPPSMRIGVGDLMYLLFSHTGHAILLARLVTQPLSLVSLLAKYRLRSKYHIEIGTNVIIGKGFVMPHPRSIIIADGAILGENVQVNQNVTIGGNNKKIKILASGLPQKIPRIGNNVAIYTGAVVAGPITIDDDVIVGANTTVTHDVPANSLVYCKCCISTRRIKVPDHGGTYFEIGRQ